MWYTSNVISLLAYKIFKEEEIFKNKTDVLTNNLHKIIVILLNSKDIEGIVYITTKYTILLQDIKTDIKL